TGAQWHVLPQSYLNYKTVDRLSGLRECRWMSPTSFATMARSTKAGATERGKGMKIMAIVDRHGLPLSVSAHAVNHHEVRLMQLCFEFYMIEAKPEKLIG